MVASLTMAETEAEEMANCKANAVASAFMLASIVVIQVFRIQRCFPETANPVPCLRKGRCPPWCLLPKMFRCSILLWPSLCLSIWVQLSPFPNGRRLRQWSTKPKVGIHGAKDGIPGKVQFRLRRPNRLGAPRLCLRQRCPRTPRSAKICGSCCPLTKRSWATLVDFHFCHSYVPHSCSVS